MEKIVPRQELHDQVLAFLYLIKQKSQKENLANSYSLRRCLELLDHKLNSEEIREMGRYLDTKGYINADFVIGDIQVSLAYKGILYIEETLQKVIEEVEKRVDNLKIKEEEETLQTIRKPIYDLLKKLKDFISKRFGKTSINTSELKKDVEIIRLELEKRIPQQDILEIKVSYIEEQLRGENQNYVRELKYMLNLR